MRVTGTAIWATAQKIYVNIKEGAHYILKFKLDMGTANGLINVPVYNRPITALSPNWVSTNKSGEYVYRFKAIDDTIRVIFELTPNVTPGSVIWVDNVTLEEEVIAPTAYRFGFNGKEKDTEGMGGGGSTYDYGFRIYNAQLAKFLSVDPLTHTYPWYSPYHFAGNSPIAHIDLDGLEEVSYWEGMRRLIAGEAWKKSEWASSDNAYTDAWGTFNSAANYNTQHLNSKVYEPVVQIHNYYVWASQKIDKTQANIKFFHAAADVTGILGVGGAYHFDVFFTGDEAEEALAGVNALLLEKNMPVIKSILNNEDVLKGKSGKEWSLDYVKKEQSYVTEYLSKKPLSEEAANEINNNLERFESLHPEYTMAKEKLGVKKLDFRMEAHRVAIGQALVELKYAEEQKSESKK